MLRKYNMASKTVVTSFNFEYIKKFKAIVPEFRIGWLIKELNEKIIAQLKSISGDEICPKAAMLTEELVHNLHREGFRVRAWGMFDENLMKNTVSCGADGMTVDFPDKLTAYLANKYKD